jgi:hypothetical protein
MGPDFTRRPRSCAVTRAIIQLRWCTAPEASAAFLAAEVGQLDEVGLAIERARPKCASPPAGATNDRMISFYSGEPVGFSRVRLFRRLIDESAWHPVFDKAEIWGHRRPEGDAWQ